MPEINDWKEVPIDDWVDITDKPLSQKEQRTTGQKIAGAVAPYARPALEYGGALAGGILAAPANIVAPGVSEVLGVAGGYTAGRAAANVLEEYAGIKKPPTPMGALRETGENVKTGLEMGMAGPIIGKGLQVAAEYLGPFAKRLYGSAIKTPLSKKWVKNLPGEEVSRRTRAIDMGIQEGVPPSEYGLQVVKKLESDTRGMVNAITKEGSKPKVVGTKEIPTSEWIFPEKSMKVESWTPTVEPNIGGIPLKTSRYGQVVQTPRKGFPTTAKEPFRGRVEEQLRLEASQSGMVETPVIRSSSKTINVEKGDFVNTEDLINKGFKKAYEIADKSSDPIGARKILDVYVKKFEAHGPEIPVDKLNEIKRQLYDEVTWQAAQKTGLVPQLKEAYKKGLAHEAMLKLEAKYPSLHRLNARDGALIDLRDALEHSLARTGNRDMISLGTKVLVGRESWPLAILNSTIGHPQVKARLAFAISKAGAMSGQTGRLLGTTGGYVGLTPQMEE